MIFVVKLFKFKGKEVLCMAISNNSSSKSSKPASSMAELMSRKAGNLQILRKGQQITGTIKKLTPREILMDI